jgi:hypothetical protein
MERSFTLLLIKRKLLASVYFTSKIVKRGIPHEAVAASIIKRDISNNSKLNCRLYGIVIYNYSAWSWEQMGPTRRSFFWNLD